jgi:acetyl esterase/lipase
MRLRRRAALALPMVLWAACTLGSAPALADEAVRIWPGPPPGTADWTGPETAVDVKTPGGDRTMHVISNVTDPTLTVVRPAAGHETGAAMIVLPGGAFGALAWDLEGTEVARWLAARGITAFVLKYRVTAADAAMATRIRALLAKPGPGAFDELAEILEPRRRIAVADALQAVRFIRANAAKYGVSPDRIGMIGFSAGAMTTTGAVLEGDAGSRPNFAAPIYGAMRDQPGPQDAPPLFIVHAEDDTTVPVGKSLEIFQAWQKAGRPAELHVYPTGGHGFGLGRTGTASAAWPQAFEAWLQRQGLLAASPRYKSTSIK